MDLGWVVSNRVKVDFKLQDGLQGGHQEGLLGGASGSTSGNLKFRWIQKEYQYPSISQVNYQSIENTPILESLRLDSNASQHLFTLETSNSCINRSVYRTTGQRRYSSVRL